ncbi:hypothetical protein [Streptomyces sp. NPDC040750]|uniref:ATP-dependent DNA ligase n=1 Tax=Streptomyces sp. NPDC040750 TaxID=3154491 RepID=UPI0033FCB020
MAEGRRTDTGQAEQVGGLSVVTTATDGIRVLTLAGEIDHHTGDQLRRALNVTDRPWGRHPCMSWTLPKPMLTTAVNSPDLTPGWAAEPKWDGYRAQLAVHSDRRVLLRSRQDTDMTGSFPEIQAAALTPLPADTGLDGVM